MSTSKNSGAVLGSLILGALGGAIAALLLAPKSGKETREELKVKAEKLKAELDEYTSDFSKKAQKVKEDLEEKLKQTEAEIKNMSEEDFNF